MFYIFFVMAFSYGLFRVVLWIKFWTIAVWFLNFLELKRTLRQNTVMSLFFINQILMSAGNSVNMLVTYLITRETQGRRSCGTAWLTYTQFFMGYLYFLIFTQVIFILASLRTIFEAGTDDNGLISEDKTESQEIVSQIQNDVYSDSDEEPDIFNRNLSDVRSGKERTKSKTLDDKSVGRRALLEQV